MKMQIMANEPTNQNKQTALFGKKMIIEATSTNAGSRALWGAI